MTARAARAVGKIRPPRSLDHAAELDVVGHLDEIRTRLMIAVGSLVVAFVGAYAIHAQLIDWLNGSIPASVEQPVTLGVAEPFMTSIKISAWAAIAVTLPVLVWQMWGFVAPAFTAEKRRAARWFFVAGTVLFASGAAFAYFVALPSAISFLTSYDADLYDVQLRAQDFYSFAAAVLVSIGLVFNLPTVLLALMRLGILPVDVIRRNRRIAYVSLVAIAVLLPGVDPVLTAIMVLPLAVLFETTVLLGRMFERRAVQRAAEAALADELAHRDSMAG